jgi:hypothetical protein
VSSVNPPLEDNIFVLRGQSLPQLILHIVERYGTFYSLRNGREIKVSTAVPRHFIEEYAIGRLNDHCYSVLDVETGSELISYSIQRASGLFLLANIYFKNFPADTLWPK